MNQFSSKIWIIIVLTILITGGILARQYWWVPKEEVKAPEAKTPEEIVFQFYQGYLEAANCGVRKGCASEMKEYVKNSNILEKSYQEILLEEEKGFLLVDPILWAQDTPPANNLQVSETAIKDETASVIVTFLPIWPEWKLKVSLSLISDEWKITDIKDMRTGLSKDDLPSIRIKE